MPTPEQLAARRPADRHLADLYGASCAACHANPEAGAPLVGDAAAWKPRLDKGMPLLLTHALEGFNGMPAGGQCVACTPQDMEALIRFMAHPVAPAPRS